MPDRKISHAQLKRLQTLWSQYARHDMVKNSRDERLRWANSVLSQTTGARLSPITSFSELTPREASDLINLLQAQLGIAENRPAKSPRAGYSRHYRDRDAAHAAGTEGRRGSRKNSTMAAAEDLALIDEQLNKMSWDRARLDAFLRSPSSPIRNRSNPQLRTLGDVNRVLWALKRIARASQKRSAV